MTPATAEPDGSGERLLAQLERARGLGFLGPGAVQGHVDHAQAFVRALDGVHGSVIDLGSGGGVPGLVVAWARPDLEVVLVDAMAKRCDFLRQAAVTLDRPRLSIVEGRAENLGRAALRGTAAVVTARSFGPPAVTAECAAPLLADAGRVLVSEPPDDPGRWPADGLARLGLALGPRVPGPPHLQWLERVAPCPPEYPRRDGLPRKRPLF